MDTKAFEKGQHYQMKPIVKSKMRAQNGMENSKNISRKKETIENPISNYNCQMFISLASLEHALLVID